MLKKFDIISIGGATQDIIYYTKDAEIINNKKNILKQKLIAFEYGAKITSDDIYLTFGGGGMNTAINFSALGLKTGTILNLGLDWIGELIIKELKSKKIITNYINLDQNHYSGFSFILSYKNYNDRTIFGHRGANKFLKLSKNQLSKIKTKWIYISSLSGNNVLIKKNLQNIFSSFRKTKIAWNPGQSQLNYGYKFFKKYLPITECFNLNKDEAIELVLSAGIKTTNMEKLLKTIYSWGTKMVLITDGHKGAYVYNGFKIYYKNALGHKGINTTGAGDAFGSSFISGLIIYKKIIKKSLKLATCQAGAVIKEIGAQKGLLNKNQITKLI